MAGYDGYAMSWNAREAYDQNEMPKSQWTKGRMLDAIEEINPECLPIMKKLNKDVIFSHYFQKKSWHHSGKFYNETDFFGPIEQAIQNITIQEMQDLLDRQIKERQEKKSARQKETEPELTWGIGCYTENVGSHRWPKWETKQFAGYSKGGYFYSLDGSDRYRIKNSRNFEIVFDGISETEANAFESEQDEKRRYAEYIQQNAYTNKKTAKQSKEEFEIIQLNKKELPADTRYDNMIMKIYYLPVSKKTEKKRRAR